MGTDIEIPDSLPGADMVRKGLAENTVRGKAMRESQTARSFALFTALVCLVAGGLILRGTVQSSDHWLVGALCGVQIVFAVGALIAWRSRWRGLTEGSATVSLATFAILTGFSIGIFLLPVAFAVGSAAIIHSSSREQRDSWARR